MKSIDIPRMIRDAVESPDFDATLITALTDISAKPEGAMLMMVAPMVSCIRDRRGMQTVSETVSLWLCNYVPRCAPVPPTLCALCHSAMKLPPTLCCVTCQMGGIEGMVPQLKPMLVSFAVTMSEKFANADISEKVPVDKVRGIVENFLEEGLSQLTPQAVKQVSLADQTHQTNDLLQPRSQY